MRRGGNCCKKLSWIFTLLAMAALAAPAFAQTNCLQYAYNQVDQQKLNCTANDVQIAKVLDTFDPATGDELKSCNLGSTFSFIAQFQVVTTSKSTRSNIGMYIFTGDETNLSSSTTVATNPALIGGEDQCVDNIIPPPSDFSDSWTTSQNGAPATFYCNGTSGPLCGTNWFDEFEASTSTPDSCGDSSSTDAGGGYPMTQLITLLIPNYKCVPPAGTNQLVLPNCTSWQVPGKTIQCDAPLAQQSYPLTPGGKPEAIPGSPSKCSCGVIPLGIIAQAPSGGTGKGCVTTDTPAPSSDVGAPVPSGTNAACSSGVEGDDEVTYTVVIKNTSNFGTITIDSITDSVYGDIGAGGACPGGSGATLCTADSSNCSTPQTITKTTPYSCTFTAHKTGDPAVATVTDTVSASGTSQYDGAVGPLVSNDVTVTPVEASSSALVTKGLSSINTASVNATFSVQVQNTSSASYDESETVTALNDSAFGDITNVHGYITATTCTVSQSIDPGKSYSCNFKATLPFASLTTVEEYGTGTCTSGYCSAGQPNTTSCTQDSDCDLSCVGLTHTNYITATINGDEGTSDVVTPTRNVLNTSVCVSSFSK